MQQLEQLNSRIRNCAYQGGCPWDWANRSGSRLAERYQNGQAHVPFKAVDYRLKALRSYTRFRTVLASSD
jgi:hypothetical protein